MIQIKLFNSHHHLSVNITLNILLLMVYDTHCSLLFEAGATIKEVQYRLGHKDVKTTLEVYAHVTKIAKAETVDKFTTFMNSHENE